MTKDLPLKKYPTTTSEVAKMLGIIHPSKDLPLGTISTKATSGLKADLPVEAPSIVKGEEPGLSHHPKIRDSVNNRIDLEQPAKGAFTRILKSGAPYAVLFCIALFVYFFIIGSLNFGAIFKRASKTETPSQSAMEQLQKQQLASYQAWMRTYYYDISESKVLDPDADHSGNGLSNFQKYLLDLNPKAYDTLGLGVADSQALALGLDPLTGANLTEARKAIVQKYIDLAVAQNRLALNHLQHPSVVAGASLNQNQATPGNIAGFDPRAIFGTASQNQIKVDTNIPGRLEISALKINVPIVWTKDPKDFDKDLKSGVAHYPGSAFPGEIGNTYISGHSSNYPWAGGTYDTVFSGLNNLANNASVKITVVQTNGKDAIFLYVVTGKQEYYPTDQAQFKNTGKSTISLSTCWPLGSTAKRLVVVAELLNTQVRE